MSFAFSSLKRKHNGDEGSSSPVKRARWYTSDPLSRLRRENTQGRLRHLLREQKRSARDSLRRHKERMRELMRESGKVQEEKELTESELTGSDLEFVKQQKEMMDNLMKKNAEKRSLAVDRSIQIKEEEESERLRQVRVELAKCMGGDDDDDDDVKIIKVVQCTTENPLEPIPFHPSHSNEPFSSQPCASFQTLTKSEAQEDVAKARVGVSESLPPFHPVTRYGVCESPIQAGFQNMGLKEAPNELQPPLKEAPKEVETHLKESLTECEAQLKQAPKYADAQQPPETKPISSQANHFDLKEALATTIAYEVCTADTLESTHNPVAEPKADEASSLKEVVEEPTTVEHVAAPTNNEVPTTSTEEAQDVTEEAINAEIKDVVQEPTTNLVQSEVQEPEDAIEEVPSGLANASNEEPIETEDDGANIVEEEHKELVEADESDCHEGLVENEWGAGVLLAIHFIRTVLLSVLCYIAFDAIDQVSHHGSPFDVRALQAATLGFYHGVFWGMFLSAWDLVLSSRNWWAASTKVSCEHLLWSGYTFLVNWGLGERDSWSSIYLVVPKFIVFAYGNPKYRLFSLHLTRMGLILVALLLQYVAQKILQSREY